MSALTKKNVGTRSASGIGVSSSLTSAFSGAKASKSVRYIKVEVKSEALTDVQKESRSGGFSGDFGRMASSVSADKCAFFIVFKDNGGVLLVSYIPDSAPNKDKMVRTPLSSPCVVSLLVADYSPLVRALIRAGSTDLLVVKGRIVGIGRSGQRAVRRH
jgi:hypothetical protein